MHHPRLTFACELDRTRLTALFSDASVIEDLQALGAHVTLMLSDLSPERAAEVARNLARRIEFVYTPVHGSWLNMVEIEISVLVRQCLNRRLPDMETLEREAKAWCVERNRLGASVEWRFRTEDARIKLRSLYPSVTV